MRWTKTSTPCGSPLLRPGRLLPTVTTSSSRLRACAAASPPSACPAGRALPSDPTGSSLASSLRRACATRAEARTGGVVCCDVNGVRVAALRGSAAGAPACARCIDARSGATGATAANPPVPGSQRSDAAPSDAKGPRCGRRTEEPAWRDLVGETCRANCGRVALKLGGSSGPPGAVRPTPGMLGNKCSARPPGLHDAGQRRQVGTFCDVAAPRAISHPAPGMSLGGGHSATCRKHRPCRPCPAQLDKRCFKPQSEPNTLCTFAPVASLPSEHGAPYQTPSEPKDWDCDCFAPRSSKS